VVEPWTREYSLDGPTLFIEGAKETFSREARTLPPLPGLRGKKEYRGGRDRFPGLTPLGYRLSPLPGAAAPACPGAPGFPPCPLPPAPPLHPAAVPRACFLCSHSPAPLLHPAAVPRVCSCFPVAGSPACPPSLRADPPACPGAPGFPLLESRIPNPESRLLLWPFKMRDTYDPCERFHERKCFCKSATYVKWDPSKTAPGGSKHYQVLIKSVQEV